MECMKQEVLIEPRIQNVSDTSCISSSDTIKVSHLVFLFVSLFVCLFVFAKIGLFDGAVQKQGVIVHNLGGEVSDLHFVVLFEAQTAQGASAQVFELSL